MSLGVTDFVIWGGNYFTDFLPPSKGWIVWDKKGRQWDDNFSDFEMAWSSFDVPAKIFSHTWMGMVQSGEREKRIHPTQKPVALSVWVIQKYMKEHQNLLDLFGGSGFNLMGCIQTGKTAHIMELAESYCDAMVNRVIRYFEKENLPYSIKLNGEPLGELTKKKIMGEELEASET